MADDAPRIVVARLKDDHSAEDHQRQRDPARACRPPPEPSAHDPRRANALRGNPPT